MAHKNKIKTGVLIQDRKNGDIVIHENNWNLIDCYQESTEVINTDDFVITQRSHFNEISFRDFLIQNFIFICSSDIKFMNMFCPSVNSYLT